MLIKELINRGKVEGRGGICIVPYRTAGQLVIRPLLIAAHIIKKIFLFRVECVRTVILYEYSVIVNVVVHIAADMIPAFPYLDLLAFFR